MNTAIVLIFFVLFLICFCENCFSLNAATRSRRGSESSTDQPQVTTKKVTRSKKSKESKENGEHLFFVSFLAAIFSRSAHDSFNA